MDLKGCTSNLRPPNFAGGKNSCCFFLLVKNSLLFLQLQSILEGSKALIGIDETRKAERLRVEKKCQHRVLTVMQTSAGTTAFTQSASYGRLWDDIHLSGHFTCRLPTICEFLPSSSRGQNIFLLDANSISQLVSVLWSTNELLGPSYHITSSCKDIKDQEGVLPDFII